VLAIPVVKGKKSPSERFAGAEDTYTIEALMQNGWALQAGTSHDLGQKFSDAFDVSFLDKEGKRQKVWSTSWGVSTRLMGAMVMTHSDDTGLVIPPNLAPIQVVIVPIFANDEAEKKAVKEAVEMVHSSLSHGGVRVTIDDRDHMRPGAKYFEWERKVHYMFE
jgi:prolyl-tRNA synthetase